MAARGQTFEELIRTNQTGRYLTGEGQVRYLRAESPEVVASANQFLNFGDALRTLDLSWAALRFSDGAQFRMKYQTRLQIERRPDLTNYPGLRIDEGAIYVTSRGGPQAVPVATPHATGVPKGTEFLISVDALANRTEVIMFDGEVELQNALGSVRVPSGWQGVAEAGQAPRLVAAIPAHSLVQWWIYYPAILNPDELALPPAEEARVSASLAAYREGDLLNALQRYPGYPDPALPSTEPGTIYLSALLLAVGALERSLNLLTKVDSNAPLARAIHTMIAAVTGRPDATGRMIVSRSASDWERPLTTSELLAVSYTHQATNNLPAALAAARSAVERATNFSFGWARAAELEFGFGRTRRAREAVRHSLTNAPRNAQALALNGFLLAAESRTREAIAMFNRAIEVDPGLGNAWLGRGLCKRRLGWSLGPLEFGHIPSASADGREGRDGGAGTSNSAIRNPQSATDWLSDLQTAAILEPRRSLLRSYAGKAFGDAGDLRLAEKELAYAKHLDTNDPTPWLYSALLKREQNRINEAVGDLEESIQRNDNRAVYRSQMMLDEDRAVRSSSLANLYQSAGLNEVALAEAARAVSYDYANYSAHQFLSESYNALRDPTRFNLRYETAWFNELLLANLLSPVGGTPLSQHVSQQEYARLFDHSRIGLTTDSSYRSDGQYREIASQYGVIGNTAWSLDLDYQHNDGVRPNNELDRIEWYTTLKHQITAQDSVLLLIKYQDYHSGDNFQYFDPKAESSRTYRFDEYQHPIALAGWDHEWSPGVHTLFLTGHLQNEQRVSVEQTGIWHLNLEGDIIAAGLSTKPYDMAYRSKFEAFTAEIQQVVKARPHSLALGARFQAGHMRTENEFNPSPTNSFLVPFSDAFDEQYNRVTAYGYYSLDVLPSVTIQGGVAYDQVLYPANFRNPPATPGESRHDQFGPKAAMVWTASDHFAFRGTYTRSLGGISLDQSYRLEPTQLAGFVQTYRNLLPVSVTGPVSAEEIETGGVAADIQIAKTTFLSLQGQGLISEVNRDVGLVTSQGVFTLEPAEPASTGEVLKYRELTARVVLNQLIGDRWAVGSHYAYTRSDLKSRFPDIPLEILGDIGGVIPDQRSDLHQFGGFLLHYQPCGFFARTDLQWYWQNSDKRTVVDQSLVKEELPGDEFPQINLEAGWRFARQRGDVSVAVLNLTGEDYRLRPLNFYPEMPRERAFQFRLRFRF